MQLLSFIKLAVVASAATAVADHAGPVRSSKAPVIARGHHDSFLTNKTAPFAVDGKKLPDVPFDIGESYAGLLPITPGRNSSQNLYFWFFPKKGGDPYTASSGKPNVTDNTPLLIWLNGGPGCSSLEGLLQENGPFLWQDGTFRPVKNPWAWANLAHMLYVDQPIGAGFAVGQITEKNEDDVARMFAGFFHNFIDTFDLHGKEVYLTGESYAGFYVPYISHHFIQKNDTKYYNFKGMMITDPSLTYDYTDIQVPTPAFAYKWKDLLGLNDTFVSNLHAADDKCGYTKYLEEHLVFPPKGPQPSVPAEAPNGCDAYDAVLNAAMAMNPCFDLYHISTTCPLQWDVLGFPGSIGYVPKGAGIYFNRTDVQDAIHAPHIEWSECSNNDVLGNDPSTPSALSVLPSVIEHADRAIIGHGLLDFCLLSNGSLLAIQNMTWGGDQGFHSSPWAKPFIVPPHNQGPLGTIAGSGEFGTVHEERGLTYIEVKLSGHMVPQYQPSAAFRMVQYLLGQVDDLSEA